MHGITEYFKADLGHKFSHSGNPWGLSTGDRGPANAVGGKMEEPNYFYTFHKKKRPNSIHLAPMTHIDDPGNRYAWKGPGWTDGNGGTYGRLTSRPNYATPVYEFDTLGQSGYSKFYTIWPPEAYNLRYGGCCSHWQYSKDSNGHLAPKFWVYHRDWYWHGKLSFGPGDSAPSTSQLGWLHGTGLRGTNLWYGDVAFSGSTHKYAKCRGIGFIWLRINADTFGADTVTIPQQSTVNSRREFVPNDVLNGNCRTRNEQPWTNL